MRRLLFISHRLPYPPDKGERVRAFHELQALSKSFSITLLASADGETARKASKPLAYWCEQVILADSGPPWRQLQTLWAAAKGKSLTEGYFCTHQIRNHLRSISRCRRFDLVFAYCSGMLPLALSIQAGARVVDLVDIDSLKWHSYAQTSGRPMSWLFRREARKVDLLQRRAIETCHAILCVSNAEAEASPHLRHKLTVIQNGVDTDYFCPMPNAKGKRPSLVFTGTMDYRPNVEAVRWFVHQVWPRLRSSLPQLTFSIVGRNPTRRVRRLSKVPGVRVVGAVPDIRPYLAEATVAVAPLRIARGVQNKILEAMASGRTVIASPQAMEGLEARPGEHLLQADTPQQWHEATIRLIRNRERRHNLGCNARKWVEQNCSWRMCMQPLVRLCERLADTKGAADPAAVIDANPRTFCDQAEIQTDLST